MSPENRTARRCTNRWITWAALACLGTAAAAAEEKKCSESADRCLTMMAQKLQARGWVGLELEWTEEGSLRVTRVIEGSPAEKAGLAKDDLLLGLNGLAYNEENREALKVAYDAMLPDSTITYRVRRKSKERDVEIRLVPIPESVMAVWVGRHMMEHHLPAEPAAAQPADD